MNHPNMNNPEMKTNAEQPKSAEVKKAEVKKDASGKFASELTPEAIAHRQNSAYRMRISGAGFQDIARALGVSRFTAARDVKAIHDLMTLECRESLDDMRWAQAERLDIALFALMPKVKNGDTKAVMAVLAIEKRRADLFGLDAPKRVEMTGENGGPMEMEANINIREKWTPQEALTRANELMRRTEILNRENKRIAEEKAKKN